MKMPAIIPSGICVVAGMLLAGDVLCEYLLRGKREFDILPFSIGLYFLGKGLFIHSLLSGVEEFWQNRK